MTGFQVVCGRIEISPLRGSVHVPYLPRPSGLGYAVPPLRLVQSNAEFSTSLATCESQLGLECSEMYLGCLAGEKSRIPPLHCLQTAETRWRFLRTLLVFADVNRSSFSAEADLRATLADR